MKLIDNKSGNPYIDLSEYGKVDYVVLARCGQCGLPICGKSVFNIPVSIAFDELCSCGQLKSKRFEDTINIK